MTTLHNIKRLERRYAGAKRKLDKKIICRHIDEQDRLIDEHGKLLTESEIKRLRAEDKEIKEMGGLIIYERSYEPVAPTG